MEKQFVPYELAVKLKELGFEFESLGAYMDKELFLWQDKDTTQFIDFHVEAPIWQQAFEFILTKVDLNIDSNTHYVLSFNSEFNIDKITWYEYEGYGIEDCYIKGNIKSLEFLIQLAKK